jgi:hypothetical protein
MFTRERLMKIGNSMASIFGGSCINAEYDEEKKVGTFYCIERGEEFIMEETEEELLKHEKEWC